MAQFVDARVSASGRLHCTGTPDGGPTDQLCLRAVRVPAERPQNMPITPHESIAGHLFSYNRHERHCGGVVAVMPCQRCLCWSLPFVCVCVLITAVPMKKLFAWGDWCVCVSFNYFALVLSLCCSTGVAASATGVLCGALGSESTL